MRTGPSSLGAKPLLDPRAVQEKIGCPRDRGPGVPSIVQSLPLELTRTADVSPSAVTFPGRKLLISFVDGQNRTQEADGSIPFISTSRNLASPIRFRASRARPVGGARPLDWSSGEA